MAQLGFWLFLIGWFVAVPAFAAGVTLICTGALLMLLRAGWWFTFEVL